MGKKWVSGRDSNPGFKKPGAWGNPFILANPKPGFRPHLNPGFRFVFFCHIMYTFITDL